jgi:uncharacterized oligopeptide transporter (OPT) family protein
VNNIRKIFEPEDKGEPGFTLRACIIALFLTIFLMITSSYIALKIGALPWPIIFSVVIAAASLQLISKFSRKTNVHEINVAQAGGTIGGLLASGVVFTIPGILYLQAKGVTVFLPSVISLASVCITAGVLGILLSVPLRRVFVEKEKLPYPSGTAGAEVIKASAQLTKNTFYITIALSITGIFVMLREWYFPAGWIFNISPEIGLALTLYPMPLAVGIGYLLGHKASLNSWFLGSAIGWIVLIPLLAAYQILEPSIGAGVMQNAGMGMVIGGGIGFFVSFVIPRAKEIFSPLFRWKGTPWYMRFTPLFSVIAFFILWFAGVNPLASLIAVFGVWIMVSVAAKMTGETDIDPLEQFGIMIGLLTTGIFAVIGLNFDYLSVFLVVCFVSIASAIAGDIGHDYKSAQILGTRVKDIIKIDMIAVIAAGLLAPLVLNFIIASYQKEFFTPSMPAPQAQMVAGSIFGFSQPLAFFLGFLIAFVWIVLENVLKKKAPILPMVFGIGLFLGPTFGILLAIGGLIRLFTDKKKPKVYQTGVILAAGIMGGEGVAGLTNKAMLITGIPAIISTSLLLGSFSIIIIVVLIIMQKTKLVK